MPASPVTQVRPGAPLIGQEVDAALRNPNGTPHCQHAPHTHHRVPWILPSKSVPSVSFLSIPTVTPFAQASSSLSELFHQPAESLPASVLPAPSPIDAHTE